MAERVFRLPPHRPVVWRTPDSLTIGVDSPARTVSDVPDAASPLLHALQEGVSRTGFVIMGEQLGLTRTQASDLLDQLIPACEKPPSASTLSVHLLGESRALAPLGQRLSQMAALTDEVTDAECVVVVADYVFHPDWIRSLSHAETPHIPVMFSDLTVSIGPVITPGQTPCMYCLFGPPGDADAEWLSVQSQLFHIRSALADTHAVDTASHVLGLLLPGVLSRSDWWSRSTGSMIHRYRADSRVLEIKEAAFHPRCQCREL